MSRSPHTRLALCAFALSAGVTAGNPPKDKVFRQTPLEPMTIRMAAGGGTLVFERTADSPTLRGQPQRWIALWQSSAKSPFYVFGQVL